MNFKKKLPTKAVYWPPPSKDGYGDFTWGAGTEIDSRWEDESVILWDGQNKRSVVVSVVYTDTQIAQEGALYKGSLGDLDSSGTTPEDADDPRIIESAEGISGLSQHSTKLYKATLQ